MLCPVKLLRPGKLLYPNGLLRACGLLHHGRLLRAHRLLHPAAVETRLKVFPMFAQPTTDAIWTHLSSDLRQFIRRRVTDDHVADDLLQETFVRVHRNLASLQEASRLAPWVYQIARNVVHDHHRSAAKSTLALADFEPTSVQDTHESQHGCRGISWLNEMIALLPASYRAAIELAEIEELPQQEVADRLGLSLSGAKSRIQRGRAMLKDIFQGCCTVELDGRGQVMACDPKPNQTVCGDCRSPGS